MKPVFWPGLLFFTGLSKTGFAGVLGLLGGPLVAFAMPPQSAVVLLLSCLLSIDLFSVWVYRASWQARTLRSLVPGAAIGIALGRMTFSVFEPIVLRVGVGQLALALVTSRCVKHKEGLFAREAIFLFLASAASGYAGFMAHSGGPPI